MKTNDYKQERAIQLLFTKKIRKIFIRQERPSFQTNIFFFPDRESMRRYAPHVISIIGGEFWIYAKRAEMRIAEIAENCQKIQIEN